MKWLAVLAVIVVASTLLLWLRSVRGSPRRVGSPSIDPVERQRIEEEIRRRHGGSGPTVDGGQHLR